ncbi:hypothetical protein NTA43_15930 [Pseudomonas aeruginosa]|uniref:hypothetical protein n=1 Tax=Pseudomonas aeruginosa TaxID=287 RepID=UPI0005BAFFD9|nr:hypothetical protein [Pseudomonas aeruginosa]AZM80480.1 hypothetical protein EIP87_00125 [Pseudomonas aeruginosa]KSN10845.1 hypothetical protein APA83_29090 [Pseudomonas aeruginosa]MCM6742421.1 hypothetical protein [Pseudomonas aeruginosa]MCR6879209.1 hypothetical protein [Pseudomonas aeruginosa]MCR6898690.1 hypothetical protein [Pseudomonas aeruginosa]
MNDRTLLELAARAAGYQFSYSYRSLSSPAVPVILAETGRWRKWDPRHDDGDALRLAVDAVILDGNAFSVWLNYRNGAMAIEGLGAREATRLAFVRVAAEIGKSMGGGE